MRYEWRIKRNRQRGPYELTLRGLTSEELETVFRALLAHTPEAVDLVRIGVWTQAVGKSS